RQRSIAWIHPCWKSGIPRDPWSKLKWLKLCTSTSSHLVKMFALPSCREARRRKKMRPRRIAPRWRMQCCDRPFIEPPSSRKKSREKQRIQKSLEKLKIIYYRAAKREIPLKLKKMDLSQSELKPSMEPTWLKKS